MNFLEIQNEVLSDRFSEAKRPNVKNWINYRYGRLWGMQDWSFKIQSTTLSVPINTTSVARGTIGTILKIWDSTVSPSFQPEGAVRPEQLYDFSQTTSGTPYSFSVIGDNIVFDRPMGIARTFQVISEAKFIPLENDLDIPLIPSEYHLLLSSGAASHGLRLENDPSWQSFEDEWNKGIEDLKMNYLSSVRTYSDALPSWP